MTCNLLFYIRGRKSNLGEKNPTKKTQGVIPADVSSSLNTYLNFAFFKHQNEFEPTVFLSDFLHKSDYVTPAHLLPSTFLGLVLDLGAEFSFTTSRAIRESLTSL